MKFFILFLAVAGVAMASPMSKREVGLRERIHERISKHGGENYANLGKEKAEETVEQVLEFCSLTEDEIDTAFTEVLANIESADMDELTVCTAITTKLESILSPMTTLVDTNCNKNHNLGNFASKIVESIVSVVDHVCHTDGEHLLELVNPCLWTESEGESDRMDKCTDDVMVKYTQHFENEFKDEAMVSVVCGASKDLFDQCVKPELDTCKLQITKDSITGLAEAIHKPCH